MERVWEQDAKLPLACEQALCLGKGWKYREERDFSSFQLESLFTG